MRRAFRDLISDPRTIPVKTKDERAEGLLRELRIAPTWLVPLEFSRRGRPLVVFLVHSGDSARSVQVWNTKTWQEVGPEPGRFGALTGVSLALDEPTLAIGPAAAPPKP